MPSSDVELDIVVVNYRTPEDLDRFLQSTANVGVHHTITVVDVGAQGDLKIRLPVDPFNEGVYTLSAEENIGYARACNWGAVDGVAPYIGLFNADVEITTNLNACIDLLASADDIAVVGPRQVNGRGRITHAGIIGGNRNAHPRGWNQRARPDKFTEIEEVTSVSGSAYLIKREVWDELTDCPDFRRADPGVMGAFLRTPHYYEETYCSYHARHHGHRVMYDGTTTIRHEWHQASPQGGWADQQFKKSRAIFRKACDLHGIEHD